METDVVIIGAGVIGLSIAYKLTEKNYNVVLIEKNKNFGMETSSRNTEVIHAGIYYKKKSFKASFCKQGKKLLYEFCKKYNVPHKKIGKLFIAQNKDQIIQLNQLYARAVENGINDLIEIDKNKLKKIEPNINSCGAIFSPSSGIIDSYNYMEKLLLLSENKGLVFGKNTNINKISYLDKSFNIFLNNDKDILKCKKIINSAGLESINLFKNFFPNEKNIPTLNPVKGSYLRYLGKNPVNHIIYPSLTPGIIKERVDATPDINNQLRFGPSIDPYTNNYSVPKNLKERMIPQIVEYLPGINIDKLVLDQSGIRPKISFKKNDLLDYIFDLRFDNNWLNLWGIESPGLTASLAIANYVRDITNENF